MFYYLNGVVALLDNNLAVIDCNGVGYACNTTTFTISQLQVGRTQKLFTYCNVKEDAFDIYGFYDMGEKRSFELLLSVSGVGPKAALSILSSSSPEGLAMAIVTDNEKLLTSAPGVGKRIAHRIILELKDKISKDTVAVSISGGASSVPITSGNTGEAIAALTALGYSQSEAASAVARLDQSLSVNDLIKGALKALAAMQF